MIPKTDVLSSHLEFFYIFQKLVLTPEAEGQLILALYFCALYQTA